MEKHGAPVVDSTRPTPQSDAEQPSAPLLSAFSSRIPYVRLFKYIDNFVVLIVVFCLLCIDILPNGPFQAGRDWLFDAYQRTWPAERDGSRTVVVEIDEESIQRVGQWPWPRNKLAKLILAAADAQAIGVDILLSEADRMAPERLISTLPIETTSLRQELLALPNPDVTLAAALRARPVVLAMTVDNSTGTNQPEPFTPIQLHQLGHGAPPALPRASGLRLPLPILAHAARGLGVISASRGWSGEIAELPAVIETGDAILPGFAMELLAVAKNAEAILLNTKPTGVVSVSINTLEIPTGASGGIRPRFIDTSRLVRIPAYRVMDADANVPSLRNAIVIIGVTASGIAETFQTPLGMQQSSPQIQAQLIESILAGDTLYRPFWSDIAEGAMGLGLGILTALLAGRIPFRVHIALLGSVVLLLIGCSIALFRDQGWLLDSILPVTCVTVSSTVALLMRFSTEIAARRRRESELTLKIMQRNAALREFELRSQADTLRHSLHFAVNAARLGIWDADLQAETWVHSPRHDSILGLSNPPASWSPAILLDRVVPQDLASVRDNLTVAEATGNLELECAIKWPNGEPHHIHVLGRYWHNADGTVKRVAGVVADITQQRSLETRLRQSEKMHAVGLLAGGVAHNFNNLLMVVLGSLELARRKVDPSSGEAPLISSAIVASRKCAEIARHLLAFGRVQPLRPATIDPAQLLATVCAMLRDALPDRVKVSLETSPDLPNINIDSTEFELALLNLAMNAKDAMPKGGQINVNAFTSWNHGDDKGMNGRCLVVEVTDNGVGIPSDQLPKVFEPFFTTKEIGKGTGLGLSQVYGFAHQSGGSVEIDSIVGQGTNVRLYLPANEVAADATRSVGVEIPK